MIITICCEKGGVGKSSIAQALAVYLKIDKRDVLLVDTDPQKTSSEWSRERIENSKYPIPCIELTGKIVDDLKYQDDGSKILVVDCGGADSLSMRSALAVSDIVLLPFRPKRRDLRTAVKMSDIIEIALLNNPGLIVRSVISQAPTLPSQYKRIENAKSLLTSLELNPLDRYTRNLNCWDDAEEDGLSILEYTEDKKGADDANGIFSELLNGITLPVSKKSGVNYEG